MSRDEALMVVLWFGGIAFGALITLAWQEVWKLRK